MNGILITDERWDMLTAALTKARSFSEVTTNTLARLDLMEIEMYSYRGDRQKCIDYAEAFIKKYPSNIFETEVATAYFFQGEELQKHEDFAKALICYRWITNRYSTRDTIWPNMDHIPRTYFRIWECLNATNAPSAEIENIVSILTNRFPDSSYLEYIQLTYNQ